MQFSNEKTLGGLTNGLTNQQSDLKGHSRLKIIVGKIMDQNLKHLIYVFLIFQNTIFIYARAYLQTKTSLL